MNRYQIAAPVMETYVDGVQVRVGYTQNYFDMAVHTTDFNHTYQEILYGVTLCKSVLCDTQMLHDYLGYPLNSRTCSKSVEEGLYLIFYDRSMDRYELLKVIGPEGIVKPVLIRVSSRPRRY